MAKTLTTQGKPIPPQLAKQIQNDTVADINSDNYNKSIVTITTSSLLPSSLQPPPPPNKYSQQYASYIGQPPRASCSASIRLGGVYK
jgi:hypothetical protein